MRFYDSSGTDTTAGGYFDSEGTANTGYVVWTSSGTSDTSGVITSYQIGPDNRFAQVIGEHEEFDYPTQVFTADAVLSQTLTKTFTAEAIFAVPHVPWRFKYIPSLGRKALAPTEHLAPLFEMEEMEGRECAVKHLREMLYNVSYRKEQMAGINAINKQLGLPEIIFDVKEIKRELKRIIRGRHKHNKLMKKLKRIQERAEILLKDVCTPEQLTQYEKEKRIEIVARNGKLYEILASGKVNLLLPNGKKKGLCVVMTQGSYPVPDVIVAKKLLLEADPDRFDKVAATCSPFH